MNKVTDIAEFATAAIAAVSNHRLFEEAIIARLGRDRKQDTAQVIDYEYYEIRRTVIELGLREALKRVQLPASKSVIQVKLKDSAKHLYPKTQDRVGMIVRGNWPKDQLYMVAWKGRKIPTVIASEFIEQIPFIEHDDEEN